MTEASKTEAITQLTRPIIGIENRTPQEAFDIMCDRIAGYLTTEARNPANHPDQVIVSGGVGTEAFRLLEHLHCAVFLAAEYQPQGTMAAFAADRAIFAQVGQFLHAHQYDHPTITEPVESEQ